jgi:Protein of unknown function (DUF3011)
MRVFRLGFVLFVVLFLLVRTGQAQTISCSSEDGEKKYCEADTRHGAHLVKQRSAAPCTQDTTWGYDEAGIWVDKGCGGDFALGSSNAAEDPGGAHTLTCTSTNGGRNYCPVETRGGVRMVKQRSDTTCTQGVNWGFDNHGIWVNKGCSADFLVGVPNHPVVPAETVETKSQTVNCSSDNGKREYCGVDAPNAKVRLIRQSTATPCIEGSTWGYDGRDIWVDRGCRGDFLVESGPGPIGAVSKEKSCAKTVGKQRAKELAAQCQQISPATYPPCNAENTCQLITDEIRRSCALLDKEAPAFCAEYR